jgi:hypothetical protein
MTFGGTKGHERREVPIPRFLLEDLSRHVAGKAPTDLVFTGERGAVMRSQTFQRATLTQAGARLGIPGFHPHELRHTAASLAIASGADIKIVQQMLGHKSATMTLDQYGHLFGDRLDIVADAMDAARTSALSKTDEGCWQSGSPEMRRSSMTERELERRAQRRLAVLAMLRKSAAMWRRPAATTGLAGSATTADEDDFRVGISVIFPYRANTAETRLHKESTAAARGHVTGAHQLATLQFADIQELYFEEGELAASRGAFEPTPIATGRIRRLIRNRRLRPLS